MRQEGRGLTSTWWRGASTRLQRAGKSARMEATNATAAVQWRLSAREWTPPLRPDRQL